MAKTKAEETKTDKAVKKTTKKVAAAKKTTSKKSTTTKKATTPKKVVEKVVENSAPVESKSESKEVKNFEKLLRESSKQSVIENFSTKDGDTGSPEVQIALASQKIINLTDHLKQNPKDNHSRRGLLKIIAKRRRILQYLNEKDGSRYVELIGKLGLKK